MHKTILSLLLMLTCCTASWSQETIDSVRFRVFYLATYTSYEGQQPSQYEASLDLGGHSSQFYNRWQRKRAEVIDSVSIHGGTTEESMSQAARYPRGGERYSLWIDYPAPGSYLRTENIMKDFHYTASFVAPQWTPVARDTIVMGYHCQFAEADYLGRHWEVCYSPDIPLNAGPWLLRGLPGLILLAKERQGEFAFEAIGVRKGDMSPMKAPRLKSSVGVSHDEMQGLTRDWWLDPDAFSERIGLPVRGFGPDGKPIKRPVRHAVFVDKVY